jgi:hypothetical protein
MLGLQAMLSNGADRPYRAGRPKDWILKNPKSPSNAASETIFDLDQVEARRAMVA